MLKAIMLGVKCKLVNVQDSLCRKFLVMDSELRLFRFRNSGISISVGGFFSGYSGKKCPCLGQSDLVPIVKWNICTREKVVLLLPVTTVSWITWFCGRQYPYKSQWLLFKILYSVLWMHGQSWKKYKTLHLTLERSRYLVQDHVS